jgi:hypothetical protein
MTIVLPEDRWEDQDEIVWCATCGEREPHIVSGSRRKGQCLTCGTLKMFVRSRGVLGRVVHAVEYTIDKKGGPEYHV